MRCWTLILMVWAWFLESFQFLAILEPGGSNKQNKNCYKKFYLWKSSVSTALFSSGKQTWLMIPYELLFANYSNKLGLSESNIRNINLRITIYQKTVDVFIKRVLLLFEIDWESDHLRWTNFMFTKMLLMWK